jgi:hypothetical protein
MAQALSITARDTEDRTYSDQLIVPSLGSKMECSFSLAILPIYGLRVTVIIHTSHSNNGALHIGVLRAVGCIFVVGEKHKDVIIVRVLEIEIELVAVKDRMGLAPTLLSS